MPPPKFWVPTDGLQDPTQKCEACKAIKLGQLPSEEQDAAPHHASLAALEQSASTCTLCRLLLWAAGCCLVPSDGQVSYAQRTSSTKGPSLQYVESNSSSFSLGNVQADFRQPLCQDPRLRFPKGTMKRGVLFGKAQAVRPYLFGNWWENPQSRKKGELKLIGLGVRLGTGPGIREAVSYEKGEVVLRGTFLRMRTDYGGDWIPGRIRAADSGSSAAFETLVGWLKDCNEQHDCVVEAEAKSLPTRVLDISESKDHILLRETKSRQTGKYIALSHSWGTIRLLTTTKATLNAHKTGIPISKLPPTFQDAVRIARQLQIPYLWIDALCIIQDDPLDWETEAARMGDVYANSYITVAATASTSSWSGCFPDPTTRYDKPPFCSADERTTSRRCFPSAAPAVVLRTENGSTSKTWSSTCQFFVVRLSDWGQSLYVTPEWMPSSIKSSPRIYCIGQFGGSFDAMADEALSTRGWTLQERLLAPRTIHYARTQMSWECQRGVWDEDGAIHKRKFISPADLRRPRMPAPPGREEARKGHWRGDRWIYVVEEYSRRDLTRGEDKLPAVSGLAHLAAAQRGDVEGSADEYFAGLWRSSFVHGLNWRVKVSEPQDMSLGFGRPDVPVEKAYKASVVFREKWRAPSWSWAAIDAQVEYYLLEKMLAEVVDVAVEPTGADAFGMVKSGWCKLKGPVYALSRQPQDARSKNNRPYSVPVQAAGLDGTAGNGQANFDGEAEFPCVVLLLDHTYGLILKDDEASRTFTRIGSVTFYSLQYKEDFLFESAVREVVIV